MQFDKKGLRFSEVSRQWKNSPINIDLILKDGIGQQMQDTAVYWQGALSTLFTQHIHKEADYISNGITQGAD